MGRIIVLGVTILVSLVVNVCSQDYGVALNKSILFFEGQRSGKLPSNQRMNWRKDSAIHDGSDIGMDLSGGYYDAGDNIKFNFPMAFTTTLLAWSVIEFGQLMGPDLNHAMDAIRWGTDYLLKSTSIPGSVVAQIGEPYNDHNCWERPEDMDTARTTYVVNQTHPGSEVSAEIAAALAASSLAFKNIDASYSKTLLERAAEVFEFADKYQGSYNTSVGEGVCPFYCDCSGYKDELVWGAAWMYKATNDQKYWNYVQTNINNMDGNFAEFGWDTKDAGINVLVSGWTMKNNLAENQFITNAAKFVCSILPNSPTKSVTYSPGGLLFKPGGSNLQHATALSFLLIVYSRYLDQAHRSVNCGNIVAPPSRLVSLAKSQVDYILGKNPLGMSYMVGYSNNYPKKIHHRGSTLPSIENHPKHIGCHDGTPYFESNNPNSNVLDGAIVGGPDKNDQYVDSRNDATQAEPTTYINAPFVGVLAYFKSFQSK
ncbi:endoglucanase 8-like [Euphorbia lathyris]|uniref:endoglucanase 8-like n=1 Tax=Euphorbia lathyris TaxID=212925 RepID=UPI00331401B0